MQVVVKIDEARFKDIQRIAEVQLNRRTDTVEQLIANGTPIPDNATNGDVIKALFGVKEVDMTNTYCVHFPEEEDYSHYFFKDWWNSPYQKGGE